VADAESVWQRFDAEGCSMRVLHPQRWRDPLWKMLATLERFWKCSTGCNCYLTPPDSQGFSPHFDDIDAFILQLEGKKVWKVYAPRSEAEMLPRYSSPNFDQHEIGDPVLEVVLEAGDMLYMPRGTLHQASCVPGAHSLHVTVSKPLTETLHSKP
jgi:lysine-specific demethylase/histidyl-hydroxylase NO66